MRAAEAMNLLIPTTRTTGRAFSETDVHKLPFVWRPRDDKPLRVIEVAFVPVWDENLVKLSNQCPRCASDDRSMHYLKCVTQPNASNMSH